MNGKKLNGIGILKNEIIYELKEGNGYIKEYDLFSGNHLLFEGEVLNGERNGKGKEYDFNGKIIFEGEYLNGKRWNGKGFKDDKIIYELKDGKGYNQEEYFDGKLNFIGDYMNGERNGKGKEYDFNNLFFEGEYLNGKRNGKGKEYYSNGTVRFECEYLNDKRNGKGK